MSSLPRLFKYGQLAMVFFLGGSLCGAMPGDLRSKQPQTDERQKGAASKAGSASANKKNRVHLQGALVEGGAECQRFRASDGRYYTLEGDLRGFHTGDHVEIIGRIPQVSHCMQDTTIHVETIRQYKAPGAHTHQQGKKPATASSKLFRSP